MDVKTLSETEEIHNIKVSKHRQNSTHNSKPYFIAFSLLFDYYRILLCGLFSSVSIGKKQDV